MGAGSRKPNAVIVVSRDDDDSTRIARKLLDGTKKDLFRFGGRKIGIENIPRDEHDGDLSLPADRSKLMERLDLFGEAISVHEPFPDMPI